MSGGKPYSFTHSLIECVLRTYYVPSTVLGSVDIKWNETWLVLQKVLLVHSVMGLGSTGLGMT